MEKQITKDNSRWTHVQTFLFEFSSDEGCFSAAFRGIVPEQEICHMLEAVRAQVYSRCAEAIHSYLDTHHLEYSDFTACRARLDHHAVMKAGDSLLHGNTLKAWINGLAALMPTTASWTTSTRLAADAAKAAIML